MLRIVRKNRAQSPHCVQGESDEIKSKFKKKKKRKRKEKEKRVKKPPEIPWK
jgi:hypothetical protein